MALGLELGVDLPAIHRYFKLALPTPHEGDAFEVVAKLLYEFARQTDGAWPVCSFLAVEDFDFHG